MVCHLICMLKLTARKLLDILEIGIEIECKVKIIQTQLSTLFNQYLLDCLLCDQHLNGPGVYKREIMGYLVK